MESEMKQRSHAAPSSLGSPRRGVALGLASAVLLALMPSVHAAGLVINGTVRDVLGVPLSGATVTDGRQTTTTDADGRYVLVETEFNTYAITANKLGYVSYTQFVDTLTNTSDVDFSLLFKLTTTISPAFFNAVPTTVTIEATSIAPSSMAVEAELDSGQIWLSYEGSSNGQNVWRATHSVTSGTSDGTYPITTVGQISGSNATNQNTYYYILDRIAPILSSPTAAPHGSDRLATRSPTPTLSVAAADDRSGIDGSSVRVQVLDSAQTVLLDAAGTFSSGRARYAVPTALPDGTYSATFTVKDRAGNLASGSFSFIEDTTIPSVLFGYPNDDVATKVPEIGARVVDSGPASLNTPSLAISGLNESLQPTFDPSSGKVTYTPLVPLSTGSHIATVSASDSAGNVRFLNFTFWVLPTLGPEALFRNYLPTSCPDSQTTLLSLLQGRPVSIFQVIADKYQSSGTDSVSRYLSVGDVNFLWSPTLSGSYTHEIIQDGLPFNTSRTPPGIPAGQDCGAPPDTNSLERASTGNSTYSRNLFGPFGTADGSRISPLPSGTYAWRVRDSLATQTTSVDRFSVLGVMGRWKDHNQQVHVANNAPQSWSVAVEEAAAIWNSQGSFTLSVGTPCETASLPCDDRINTIVANSLGQFGPLAISQFHLVSSGIWSEPDIFECCFRITLNSNASLALDPNHRQYDLVSVLAHELGHSLGVGHDYNFEGSIMHNLIGPSWRRHRLSEYDRESIRFLYP